jgi:hypothetical protein
MGKIRPQGEQVHEEKLGQTKRIGGPLERKGNRKKTEKIK